MVETVVANPPALNASPIAVGNKPNTGGGMDFKNVLTKLQQTVQTLVKQVGELQIEVSTLQNDAKARESREQEMAKMVAPERIEFKLPPERKAKVGLPVVYWEYTPTEVAVRFGIRVVPATIFALHSDGTVGLTIHDPSGQSSPIISPNPKDTGQHYSKEPKMGCWCWPEDVE